MFAPGLATGAAARRNSELQLRRFAVAVAAQAQQAEPTFSGVCDAVGRLWERPRPLGLRGRQLEGAAPSSRGRVA